MSFKLQHSVIGFDKPSSIGRIPLRLVDNGVAVDQITSSEQLWSGKYPAVIYVTRRPGCGLCRELAIDLCEMMKSSRFQDVRLIGIIKEVAPVANIASDEQLGVGDFQNVYFAKNPVYLDETRGFYKALGNKSILHQKCYSWNIFKLYRDYKQMAERFKSRHIINNFVGESLIQGGVFVVCQEKNLLYSFHEVTGFPFPYHMIAKAIDSCFESFDFASIYDKENQPPENSEPNYTHIFYSSNY